VTEKNQMATTADNSTNSKSAKRRFFRPRFTLAALLVLITLVAIPLGYVAQRRAWNLRRKAAYELLTAKGVALMAEVLDEFAPATAGPPAPLSGIRKWWHELLGEDAAPRVKHVVYGLSQKRKAAFASLLDHDLKLLSHFPEIERIEIRNAESVSDGGLTVLVSLPQLKEFQVGNLPLIKGDFLRSWSPESPLEAASFARLDQFNGENLANLNNVKKIKKLWLDRCPLLSDVALRSVTPPESLDNLMIHQCPVGDETITPG
jgi:hypothetical protein